MTMFAAGLIILGVALAIVGLSWVLPAWLQYRGTFVITCPDSCEPAGVKVDTRRVVRSAWGGAPDVRLRGCSRWPEKTGCAQDCLPDVEREATAIDAAWHHSQACFLCGNPIPGALADLFSKQQPVCWDCHVVNSVVGRERALLHN